MDREQSQTEMPASRLVGIKPFVIAGVSNKHSVLLMNFSLIKKP